MLKLFKAKIGWFASIHSQAESPYGSPSYSHKAMVGFQLVNTVELVLEINKVLQRLVAMKAVIINRICPDNNTV